MHILPKINPRYWVALTAASIFGTNTGDYAADILHIGHLQGLPWMLLAALVVVGLERFSGLRSVLFFWAVIIIIRTAATNLGDGFHSYHLGFNISLPILTALFAGLVYFYSKRGGGVGADGAPQTNTLYWLCMLLAGALGTVAGDFVAYALIPGQHSALLGTLESGVVMVALFAMLRQGRLMQPLVYWPMVALIRLFGTCAGDALAGRYAMNLQASTLGTGLAFAALITFFYIYEKGNAVARAAA